jgi:hypothetical protein
VTDVQMLTGRALARVFGSFVVGAVIGVVGTGIHRWTEPWGLVIALVIVLVGGALGRAWTGWLGIFAVGMGVATATGLLGTSGPGGDVIIAAQPIGYVWFGGALVVALAGVLPCGWFSDAPAVRQGDSPDAS